MKYSYQDYKNKLDKLFEQYANKEAITYMMDNGTKVHYSFKEVSDRVYSWAKQIFEFNIEVGDRVAIIAPLIPNAVIAGISLAYANITTVMLDATLPVEEINRLLEYSDVRGVFTTENLFNSISQNNKNIPYFDLNSSDDDIKTFQINMNCISKVHTVDKDPDIMVIIYSSGTTSSMKGIMLPYNSVLLSIDRFADFSGLTSDKSYLVVLPFYHISGYASSFIFFLTGCTLGIIENINSTKLQKGMLDFNPHCFGMVPKVYDIIADKIIQTIHDKGRIVEASVNVLLKISKFFRKNFGLKIGRIIFKPIYSKAFGKNIWGLSILGTVCKKETAELFLNFGLEWANLYATTETNAPITSTGIYDKYPVNAVGNVLRLDDIEVIINQPDKSGVGEIYVKTELIMKGYFKDSELTSNSFDNGYFKTGDLGYIDENNYLYIVGRNKDSIILHNGKKVSATDIDAFYQKLCPTVNIASCGILNEDGYDEVYLFVEKGAHSEDTVHSFINQITEKSSQTNSLYKISQVFIIDKIPVTSVGKVKRYLLKEYVQTNAADCNAVNNNYETKGLYNIDIVINAVRTLSNVHCRDIDTSTRLVEDLSLDSLSLYELCVEIETVTKVNLSDKMYGVKTVGDIVDLLDSPGESSKFAYDINSFPIPKRNNDLKFIFRFNDLTKLLWNFEISGIHNIPQENKIIFCPNHESYFDAMWVASALNQNRFELNDMCCMAAEHLMNNKLMKKAFVALGGIPVDRTGNTAPAIERALQCLNNERCFMLIHPEGTRTRNGELGEFKLGAAKLSIESGVKIVPVCINGAYEIFPPHRKLPRLFDWKHFRRYTLQISFGTPIDPSGKTAEDITDEIKRQIVECKDNLRRK